MAKSKYNTGKDADTTSAGMGSKRSRALAVVDTVTKAEAQALAAIGISTTRVLTAFTMNELKAMAPESLRDLAASIGKVEEGPQKGQWLVNPNGTLGGVFERIRYYRASESRSLGQASRRIQTMRTEAALKA